MKLILSRKGFDSASGGAPSPILPDGTMISIPIPDATGNPFGDYDALAYKKLSYSDIMLQLGISVPAVPAHRDPELTPEAKSSEWRGIFGQSGAAQQHLDRQGIARGDLFLFFGLFRHTDWNDGRLQWKRDSKPVHALWGYLEVGEIFKVDSAQSAAALAWAKHHPHVAAWDLRRNNCVYVAPERLTLDRNRGGAGTLRWNENLRLTETEMSPSRWKLPAAFSNIATTGGMTFHGDLMRWNVAADGVRLRTVGRGQEFVIADCASLLPWVKDILGLPTHDLSELIS